MFAQTCVFAKQSLGPFHCDLYCYRHLFSRSYEVILPSSLTRVIPSVLGFSPRPPVSVCGTGTSYLLSSFSRQCEFVSFPTKFSPHHHLAVICVYFTAHKPHDLATHFHPRGLTILLCPCIGLNRYAVVLEYLPVVHHLRLSAST